MPTPPEIDWCVKYTAACKEMRQLRNQTRALQDTLITLTAFAAADRRTVEALGDGPWPDATAAIEHARGLSRAQLSLGDKEGGTP